MTVSPDPAAQQKTAAGKHWSKRIMLARAQKEAGEVIDRAQTAAGIAARSGSGKAAGAAYGASANCGAARRDRR